MPVESFATDNAHGRASQGVEFGHRVAIRVRHLGRRSVDGDSLRIVDAVPVINSHERPAPRPKQKTETPLAFATHTQKPFTITSSHVRFSAMARIPAIWRTDRPTVRHIELQDGVAKRDHVRLCSERALIHLIGDHRRSRDGDVYSATVLRLRPDEGLALIQAGDECYVFGGGELRHSCHETVSFQRV